MVNNDQEAYMYRRRFLQTSGLLLGMQFACGSLPPRETVEKGRIVTVCGSIAPQAMGITLPHEHVLVDFVGADKIGPGRYDPDEAFEIALPYLVEAKKLGCDTLVECTPKYIGRDPALLRRLSEASGMHLLTNTGYYGAANDKFVPAHAYKETADQLAYRWIREWQEGIEDTGVKPGFIKIGVDKGLLSEIDRKLVRAAAQTHLATGLTIAAHTGDGVAAMEELAVLDEEGVAWNAFIWVHAQNEKNPDVHAKAAEGGAWLEFDGISTRSIERHVECVREMKTQGHLNRVMLSHDAGWYSVGEPRGGAFRPYDTLFTQFLPALRKREFTEAEIRMLLRENPSRAFRVDVRKA